LTKIGTKKYFKFNIIIYIAFEKKNWSFLLSEKVMAWDNK